MLLSLAQVLEATGAHTIHSRYVATDSSISGWSIDSRTINPGDLFFAIRGESYDGHAFVEDALARGAFGAVVSEPNIDSSGLILRVRDTVQALQQIAAFARRNWGRGVVAVTGSAGKTTTKDIIAAFLGVRFEVARTIGNLNNHLGLPLSILRTPDKAEVAVYELGMNHAGEIRQLASIARPDIGVVTNVGYAHVEAFDSIEGVAAAKRELVEALPPEGIAVLNADDHRVASFRKWHPGRTVTYGLSDSADVRATKIVSTSAGTSFEIGEVRFETVLVGMHSLLNVLAGVAAASVYGVRPGELVESVAGLRPARMRGERITRNGVTILNDSYNSNPEAARRMLDVLREEPGLRRIAVLGEMLELGSMTENLHRDLGTYAARSGLDLLLGVSGASRFIVEEARRAGVAECAAIFFQDPESAGAFLHDRVRSGDVILFKGSRGTRIEKALARMEE